LFPQIYSIFRFVVDVTTSMTQTTAATGIRTVVPSYMEYSNKTGIRTVRTKSDTDIGDPSIPRGWLVARAATKRSRKAIIAATGAAAGPGTAA
jgi:N-acyl-L-homoserine lactone synthetase